MPMSTPPAPRTDRRATEVTSPARSVERGRGVTTPDEQHNAPEPRRPPGVVLALVSGAQFMIILDLAIVNVALSSIQADLGA